MIKQVISQIFLILLSILGILGSWVALRDGYINFDFAIFLFVVSFIGLISGVDVVFTKP